MRSWKRINHPATFQGNLKKKKYFEGWYNKIVTADEQSIFAFIPTLALNKQQKTSHSAIQFFDGKNGVYKYFKYDIKDFENLSQLHYEIRIGNSYFSSKGLAININKDDYKIKGSLRFNNLIPWENKFLQPGVMGFTTFFPLLETYHGIVSMNHTINGSLQINNKKIVFDNGKGYIEKDWGSSFPSSWIWMQTNHFKDPNLSLVFSIAKVPFLNFKITGFFCVIWYQNKFLKFTTYTGAKVPKLNISSDKVDAIIKDKSNQYIVHIDAVKGNSTDLKAPTLGLMTSHDNESLTSKIKIKLYQMNKYAKKYDLIIDDVGRNAGLEIMDNNELNKKLV